MSDVKLEDIVSLAKRRGFIYPSSEIYGGLAGVYDYGPLGVKLKHNIQNLWWNSFVAAWDDMYPMDAAILMNKKVWEASGHASGFNDPMVECGNCHSRLRADHVEGGKCPVCGKEGQLSEPRQFNMMFKTNTGPVEDENSVTYLRPETAQGMFVNFKNVIDTFYPDMPFGMAQIGKGFRNEISPREFLFRLRELEMMEIEYFVHPGAWEKAFEDWRTGMQTYFKLLGLPEDKIHELEVPEADRAHYSQRTIDFEFDFPFGRRELAGLAYRTDYDLKKHQEVSGKSMEYKPKDGKEAFIPHVIEPSFGVERLTLAVLSAAYTEDEINGEKRTYLKLPTDLAPVKLAVSPLLKNKPELVAKAREVYEMLKKEVVEVMWDDNGNIGKRYRRQDEIGTPFCVTIDFDSIQDDTVTLRNRDTTQQERVKIDELISKI
jgi:glycyl-tRNA synthetase